MTAEVAGRYTVRPAQIPRDAHAVLSLWKKAFPAFGNDAGDRKLRTMYHENPAGTGSLFLLYAPGGDAVGVMGLGRRAYRLGDKTIRGCVMADLTVAEEHRSLGPAVVLMRGAVGGSRDDFDLLFGFPNDLSEAVVVRAGYRKLGDMTRYGRPLRSGSYLRTRFRRSYVRLLAPLLDAALWLRDVRRRARYSQIGRYREGAAFEGSFDSLWASCSKRPALMAERSVRMLTWYFCELSAGTPWLVSTARAAGSGEVEGYAVWRIQDEVARVADFLWADARVGLALLERVSWTARRRGCTSVTAEFSGASDVAKTLRDAGFHPRETRPIYHVRGESAMGDVPSEWYMTGFDRDAI